MYIFLRVGVVRLWLWLGYVHKIERHEPMHEPNASVESVDDHYSWQYIKLTPIFNFEAV
jgi:hypothetical protein